MNDEVLLPGHGLPIVASDRVERALTRTAEVLGFIHDATLRADADDPQVRAIHARVYEARRDLEPSTMAKGIFGTAARGSEPDG